MSPIPILATITLLLAHGHKSIAGTPAIATEASLQNPIYTEKPCLIKTPAISDHALNIVGWLAFYEHTLQEELKSNHRENEIAVLQMSIVGAQQSLEKALKSPVRSAGLSKEKKQEMTAILKTSRMKYREGLPSRFVLQPRSILK